MIQHNGNNTLLNQADGKTLIAQAATQGSWQVRSETAPILAVHAALLRTGKVLFIAGSGNNPTADSINCTNCTAVWDVSAGTFNQPDTPVDEAGYPIDLFCGGQTFLPDGRLLFVGGTLQYDPFYGRNESLVFDPSTETWTKVASMKIGRWYPTVLPLGNGKVLVVSGLNGTGVLSRTPEIYDPGTNTWTKWSKTTSSYFPQYAHLFLTSDGSVFHAGGYMGGNYGTSPRKLSLTSPYTETAVSGLKEADVRNQAGSVLLAPAQNQKIMTIAGGVSGGDATNSVYIVDLTASTPTYTAAASLNYARMHVNAVLLPDRKVFVCGGSSHDSQTDSAHATLAGEIYDPVANTWTVAASNTYVRVYHSGALLLPDGRVALFGGNPGRGNNELHLEIYSPPYISQTRPQITSAPASVSYGGTITIGINSGANIKWVSLIRPSTTTHSCNAEQRVVDCTINSFTSTSLNVTVTSNSNIAPPGYYMLFITDQNNVPSVASWIKLTS